MSEMINKLTQFFKKNNDLKVFSMNGSKTNKNIKKDIFQDYDVVFFTDDVKKYKEDRSFLKDFGELMIVTEPDDDSWNNLAKSYPKNDGYIYLVQFMDGERIDFQFLALDLLPSYLKADSLTQIIDDKDNLIDKIIKPTDKKYWQSLPEKNQVSYSVKEFWWQFNNTLKATLRDDFLFAQFIISITRDELIKLITWTVSIENGLNKNYGKKNDLIFQYLNEKEAISLKETFNTATKSDIYHSLKVMGELEILFLQKFDKITQSILSEELKELKNVPTHFLNSKNQRELGRYFDFTS